MPELKPIAYMYHDAKSAESASWLVNSILLVTAGQRKKGFRNETELFTRGQLEAAIAAERARCAAICTEFATSTASMFASSHDAKNANAVAMTCHDFIVGIENICEGKTNANTQI